MTGLWLPSAAARAGVLLWILVQSTTVAADTVVGTATLELENPANARKVITEMWFKATPGSSIEWYSPRAPIRPIPIARNADLQLPPRKHPVIVISHGNWGSRFSQGWLALELVKAGYIVLSISHPGTVGEDQTVAGRYRLWDRSSDVSFALNEVLKHPKWAPLIDETRIGFVGHSFGGWTGVSLAGGLYDPARQRAFCEQVKKKDFYCEAVLKDNVEGISAADAGASFKDGRIKAFYIMATGPGQGFSARSLNAIAAPFVVDTAEFDEILEPGPNSSNLATQIPGAKEKLRPVGHFVYVPQCRWIVGPMLTKLAGLPLCDDPKGVDRSLVHKQVISDIAAFFDKQLVRAD